VKLTPGTRLRAPGSTAEVVVVRAPQDEVELTCASVPMVDRDQAGDAPGATDASPGSEVLMGKRYSDPDSGLELLCTTAGPGPLAVDGRELGLNAPKPLPSSD
jgi:hypothetical protein